MKNLDRNFYVCDFETSTEEWVKKDGFARVWLWGLYDWEKQKFEYGNGIVSFMRRVLVKSPDGNPVIYFHNLKYDGSYILNWLFRSGYTYDEELSSEKTFKTAISDVGLWYTIEVCIYKYRKQKYIIRFQDSLKKIPLPVREIPKAFGFDNELAKGDIDYDLYRPVGYQPNKEELSYVFRDCYIVARGLHQLEEQGFTKMTGSSDAFYAWKCSLQSDIARKKRIKPEHTYRSIFPKVPVEVDDYIRRAYRGGWTYVNPKFAGQIITRPVEVYDINSMYPAKMVNKYLPMGQPMYFKGKPHPDKYQCYIARVRFCFDIKKDHLPCIQLKHSYLFNPTDYVTSSDDKEVEMTVTNVDLKLIFSQYHVTNFKYIDGYYFRKCKGYFDRHIEKNMAIKEKAVGGERYIAKSRMNQVYGKTATSPHKKMKIPCLIDGILRFDFGDEKVEEPEYTALGCFITAWARHDIILDAQANYENFIYCDTDSLHLLKRSDGTEPNLPIHPTKLGFYKLEHNVVKSTFLRSKTYVEQYDNGDVEIKCAGASSEVKKNMNFDNFKEGNSFEGKLMPKQVVGGCVLVKTIFTIQ